MTAQWLSAGTRRAIRGPTRSPSPMATLTRSDVERVARLARLDLTVREAERIAPTLEAITRDFASLAEEASRLPAADEDRPARLRDDVVQRAAEGTVERILHNARVDPRTRKVQAHHE